MKQILPLMVVGTLCLFSSCVGHETKPSDATADTELGLTSEEERGEAEQTLEELKDAHLQEQRRRLERQVTEPQLEPVIPSSET